MEAPADTGDYTGGTGPRADGRIDVLIGKTPAIGTPRHAFSEVPRPIAMKLGHMVGNCLNLIIQVQKFGGPPPKKIWGPKTCKISVDFIQPPTLIVNISGTAQDI